MKKIYSVFALLITISLVACQRDIPEPETNKSVSHLNKSVEASVNLTNQSDPFLVKHKVNGKNVYIECIVKGVSFRNHSAKMVLSIDGKKKREVNNAAFVVKEMHTGNYRFKLDLFRNKDNHLLASKEFDVIIP